MFYLVTGGLGYLGGRLVEYLLNKGNRVRVTTRRPIESCPQWAKKWEILQIESLNRDAWLKAIEDINFVFHLAAPDASISGSDPVSALRAGGENTWALVDAVANTPEEIPILNVSTIHVYGSSAKGLVTETFPPRPVHPYAVGHLFSEIVTRAFCSHRNIPVLNVRLSNAFGKPVALDAAKWSLVFNDLCRQAVTSNRLYLKSAGYQKRNFITLEDTVRALLFLASRSENWPDDQTIHVGSSVNLSIREVAERIAGRCKVLWGEKPEVFFSNETGAQESNEFIFDVSRLKETGFVWRNSFDQEIDDTLEICKKWGDQK
ncbi:MAG: SDR family oxidoreductase [Deltaproteobacteria bacterium]|nr:SDR family oxidoreductase [Deltaproteobacteria bacterium]MBW2333477.1 SDR family oxidoreductase [Deltaproteobacteria bacterium]